MSPPEVGIQTPHAIPGAILAAHIDFASPPPGLVARGFHGNFSGDLPPEANRVVINGVVNRTERRGFSRTRGGELSRFGRKIVDACRYLVEHSDRAVHVVDVGAGGGDLSVPMAQIGAMVTAIDCQDSFTPAANAMTCHSSQRPKPGMINHIITTVQKADPRDFPWTTQLIAGQRFGHWLPDEDFDKALGLASSRAWVGGAIAMFSLASFESDFVKGRYYTAEQTGPDGRITQIRMPVTEKTPIQLRHVPAEKPGHLSEAATPRTYKEARHIFEKHGWDIVSITYSPTRLLQVAATRGHVSENLIRLIK